MQEKHTDQYSIYNADCVDVVSQLPDNSVDFSVYSPPFSSLYIYSESERDMGNCKSDEEFIEHYKYLIREKLRVTKAGRLSAIHVKDLVYYSNASAKGDRGLKDFTGDCIRAHLECGWTLHSKVTIWRCPVREMTKTKPDGLLYKNFRGDCGRNRVGMPEYLIVFRKWDDDAEQAPPIMHDAMEWKDWAGEGKQFVQSGHYDAGIMAGLSHEEKKVLIEKDPNYVKLTKEYLEALDIWQNWASPVWMDTQITDVLNVKTAREDRDEKHLCPMPLDITERAIRMWSNKGDAVLSPFMGIGSEGVVAMRTGRKYIGVELKEAYFNQAFKNIEEEASKSAFGTLL